MYKIILDFEMNCTPKREIIEIGAVKLNEANCIISEFQSFVRPDYELSERMTKLTGIKKKDLDSAPSLEVALAEFFKWCGSNDYEIYSWSKSDLQQLVNETIEKKIFHYDLQSVLLHWVDYQMEFGKLINYPGELSLKNALAAMGKSFCGKQHCALEDARNTAEVFIYASGANNQILNTIRELFVPKKIESSIGELFPDLSSLLCT